MCWVCGQQESRNFVADGSAAAGTTSFSASAALPVYSIAEISNQLLNGYWADQGSSAFRWASSNTTITFNVTGLTAARADLARLAFATWQEVSGLTFQETAGAAEISLDDNSGGASANWSTWNNNITSASVNVAASWESGASGVDSYTFGTFIHEIGHTLGLGHGGNYNGNATYGYDNHYRNDTTQFTVMSYFGQDEYGGASYRDFFTPMMADIHAVQSVYGAGTARSGNTTYGFNVAGLDAATAQLYTFSNWSMAPALTLYDSGGIDTLDVSGYSQSQVINLAGGAFSNIGGLIGNIGIYTTSVIENAVGGSGNDTIYGNAANNVLTGGGGNDTLFSWGGSDVVYGGAGNDTMIAEGVVVWTSNAATIRRLYLATLDRGPDDGGFQGWTNALSNGQPLNSIVSGFINSAEFQSKYGGLNNDQFVTLLYRNVLGREPDAGGFSGWVGALNSGQSREFCVTGFSESAEFQSKTDIREISGQIYRLYDSCFNRSPDLGGFWGWVDTRYGNTKLTDVASHFINSVEFTNTYGTINSLSNASFVELLYNNVLNRASDAAGAQHWIQALDSNTLSRVDVLLSFSDSVEHIGLLNFGLQSFMRADTTGFNDVLYGGVGNDSLTGRFGSDRFIFNAADGGTDTIYGFEVFDTIEVNGFGFNSVPHVLQHMSQQGGNVIFSHGNNTIIFQDTQLSVLHNMTSSGWIFS